MSGAHAAVQASRRTVSTVTKYRGWIGFQDIRLSLGARRADFFGTVRSGLRAQTSAIEDEIESALNKPNNSWRAKMERPYEKPFLLTKEIDNMERLASIISNC
jgi:hypothetical protein